MTTCREIVNWNLPLRINPQAPFIVSSPGDVRHECASIKDACIRARHSVANIPGLTIISHMGVTIERWTAVEWWTVR